MSPDKEWNYFESAALIHFEKIYFIFMSGCFKSFNVYHHFSKTAALVQKTSGLGHSDGLPKLVSIQIRQVNDEEQLLRIFRCLQFEIKCNDHKKLFIWFSLTRTFSAFKSMYKNINRIIGLSCRKKGVIGVVMSFEQEHTVFLQLSFFAVFWLVCGWFVRFVSGLNGLWVASRFTANEIWLQMNFQ